MMLLLLWCFVWRRCRSRRKEEEGEKLLQHSRQAEQRLPDSPAQAACNGCIECAQLRAHTSERFAIAAAAGSMWGCEWVSEWVGGAGDKLWAPVKGGREDEGRLKAAERRWCWWCYCNTVRDRRNAGVPPTQWRRRRSKVVSVSVSVSLRPSSPCSLFFIYRLRCSAAIGPFPEAPFPLISHLSSLHRGGGCVARMLCRSGGVSLHDAATATAEGRLTRPPRVGKGKRKEETRDREERGPDGRVKAEHTHTLHLTHSLTTPFNRAHLFFPCSLHPPPQSGVDSVLPMPWVPPPTLPLFVDFLRFWFKSSTESHWVERLLIYTHKFAGHKTFTMFNKKMEHKKWVAPTRLSLSLILNSMRPRRMWICSLCGVATGLRNWVLSKRWIDTWAFARCHNCQVEIRLVVYLVGSKGNQAAPFLRACDHIHSPSTPFSTKS